MWRDFLELLSGLESPLLVHYGHYETTFRKIEMCERYGSPPEGSVAAKALAATLNLLTVIFARIYFPTHSNGLKARAKFVGFQWSIPNASGPLSVVWRSEWEQSRDQRLKQALITYNAEDCEALRLLTEFVGTLSTPTGLSGMDTDCAVNVESLRPHLPFKLGKVQFQLPELEAVNRAAYWDYQRDKIFVRSSKLLKRIAEKAHGSKRVKPRANKFISWPSPTHCPKCGATRIHKHRSDSKTVLDVKFVACGIKRWITKYLFYRYRCPKCGAVFHNQDRAWTGEKCGANLRLLSVYENIGLRMPQQRVALFMNEVLGFDLPRSATNKFKADAAAFYEDTYDRVLKKIVSGQLIHADETKINHKAGVGYVWAFTNLEDAAYVYAPSREGSLVHALLKDFKGVLVTDFYTAYDSVNCPQQKCLIHLIRDLNDDLMHEPFDEEMKELVGEFAVLLKAIIVTVDRFGLRARFLRPHKASTNRFFELLALREYRSETARKCKIRLEKNRHSLFTFLDFDGVPWNNNNAEHAIKAFALLRRDFGGCSY